MLRGLEARCVACGARRPLFASKNLTWAGEPSRVGGLIASLSGWAVLIIGLSIAIFAGLLLQTLWPAGFVGWAVAIPILIMSLFAGLALVLTGRRLKRKGANARKTVLFDALRTLAAHNGGAVSAERASRALDLTEAECDELLTELAKDPGENVSLEVDDDGQIQFLFGIPEKRWRVLEETEAQSAHGAPAHRVESDESGELDREPSSAGSRRARR